MVKLVNGVDIVGWFDFRFCLVICLQEEFNIVQIEFDCIVDDVQGDVGDFIGFYLWLQCLFWDVGMDQ